MKLIVTLGLLVMAWLPMARAQLLVEVNLEQEQFLPGETLTAVVRVTNRSGQTLHLGGEADWLTFSVESRDNLIVEKNGEAPVLGEFTLDTAKVATKKVNLAPYFSLTRPGRYRIIATVRIKEWGAQMASPPKDLAIVEGVKVWSREFGVPQKPGVQQPPELRRFTLLQVNYLRSEIRLYFRLSDGAESRLFKIFPLGNLVSFGRPEAEVDGRSQLHVLQQNGARTAVYSVVSPDGELRRRQFYDFGEARPKLQLDREGNISVTGGLRRLTKDDLPVESAPEPAKP